MGNSTDETWRKALLSEEATLEQTIRNLDESALQIVLIVSPEGVLLGTITDGDIRRGLLRGLSMTSSIKEIMHQGAFVVSPDIERETVVNLMQANKLHQLPIVDEEHRVIGLHLWDEVAVPATRSNKMVIMVGGLGTRLRPHTDTVPKPMLPVAGKPMLEHIIENAKAQGFDTFVLAINYLGHLIEKHFGTGEKWGVNIEYLREEAPLGTAGALALLTPRPEEPFIVINGDVLTDIRYGDLLDFHARHKSSATMAVRLHEWEHPFGVVQIDGLDIVGFDEKPIARSHINAGIYAIEPRALDMLDDVGHFDMPSLFLSLRERDNRVVAYPMHEPWLDVGREKDFQLAQTEVEKYSCE